MTDEPVLFWALIFGHRLGGLHGYRVRRANSGRTSRLNEGADS